MDAELAEIKSRLDIVELISGYLSLKKAGRNYRGLCPFHSEKTASFMVSPELQIFKCFGCNESGDVFSFLMKTEGLDFPTALRMLAERAGVKLKAARSPGEENRKQKLSRINELSSDFFSYLLKKHAVAERARDYLKGREIRKETIETFGLGYAPDSWQSLSDFLLKRGFSSSEIVEAGLALPKKKPQRDLPIYDRFRGRVMFPLRDSFGRVLGFSGRALNEKSEPKYLNSPESAIFRKGSLLYGLDLTKQEIKKVGAAVLVEGQFDLILPYQVGVRNIVASLGTALTEVQLSLLRRFTEKVTLAFDADSAGSQALVRSVELAENAGLTVSAVILPEGMKDPDEAARRDPLGFEKSIAEGLPFYDYYLRFMTKGLNTEDLHRKKKIADEFTAYLARLESPVSRAHYLGKLAQALSLDASSLNELLRSKLSGRAVAVKSGQPPPSRLKSSPGLIQKYLLFLILNSPPNVARELLDRVEEIDFSEESLRNLLAALKKIYGVKKGAVDPKTIRDKLDEAERGLFDEVYLFDSLEVFNRREELDREAASALERLRRTRLERELKEISLKIRQAEKDADSEEVESLRQKFQKRIEKLKQKKSEPS